MVVTSYIIEAIEAVVTTRRMTTQSPDLIDEHHGTQKSFT
jgi:kynureninase